MPSEAILRLPAWVVTDHLRGGTGLLDGQI